MITTSKEDIDMINYIITRMLDYKELVSGNDIYKRVEENTTLKGVNAAEPTFAELEKLVEAGTVARYKLDLPKNQEVSRVVDRKMPEYYYKLVKTK